MRDIKFRAWDRYRRKIVWNSSKTQLRFDSCGDWYFETYKEETLTSNFNSILMQYTGLKDKNGVEIYESDLCKCHDGEIRVVEENIEETGFKLRHVVGMSYIEPLCFDDGELEIIGNIYEQPELLEV